MDIQLHTVADLILIVFIFLSFCFFFIIKPSYFLCLAVECALDRFYTLVVCTDNLINRSVFLFTAKCAVKRNARLNIRLCMGAS